MLLKKMFNIIMYAFIFIVTLVPFEKIIGIVPLSANFVLSICAIFLGVVYVMKNRKVLKDELYLYKNKNLKIFFIIIIAYTALGLLSVIYSKDKFSSLSETSRILEYVFLFYLTFVIADKKFIKNGFSIFYIAMIIASIYGLIQFGLIYHRFMMQQDLCLTGEDIFHICKPKLLGRSSQYGYILSIFKGDSKE